MARLLAGLFGLLCSLSPVRAEAPDEYRLKVAFIYNFISFTEWPAALIDTLNLCVYGADPFGEELDKLHGRSVAGRALVVRRLGSGESLAVCQIVFITRPMIANLPRLVDQLKGRPVLTVADTPGAARRGVIINMITEQSRIQFEANSASAHDNGLVLSSKLLRLAREVYQ